MTQGLYGDGGRFRYPWQEQIAGSGLPEVLTLAKQLKESGLFDEGDKAYVALRQELKQLTLVLANGLVAALGQEPSEPAQPPAVREQMNKHAASVRQKVKQLGNALGQVR